MRRPSARAARDAILARFMPPANSGTTPADRVDDPAETHEVRAQLAPQPPTGLSGRLIERLEADGRYSTWVLMAALAGMFATTFPVTILTISLGSMAEEFGTTQSTMAWVISGPMLLSAMALPLLGKLGDMQGHRRIFLLGFCGATLVAALTALAWSPTSLIGLRTLAAVMGGATQPTSMALIFSVYPPEQRVRAMGWWSMTGAAAPALGLVAGGPLVDWLGWRVVFVLQALISAMALGLAAAILKETPRQRVRFDVLGAITLTVGVAGCMFSLGQVRSLGIGSPWIAAGLATGALGLAAFVAVERRTEEPLLPLSFFGERNFSASIVSNAFMSAAYMGAFVIAPFVLLQIFGFSITTAAGVMLLRTLTLTIASPLGGTLGYRIGERGAALVGSTLMTFALCLLAYAVLEQNIYLLATALVLQGAGHGLALPSLTSAIAGTVPERDLGIASAANRLTGQAGAAFGITLLTLVYGDLTTPEALGLAFLAGAALSAISVAAAWGMSRGPVGPRGTPSSA
jgi:EmrB/QacA subfamily drug resistance transporter